MAKSEFERQLAEILDEKMPAVAPVGNLRRLPDVSRAAALSPEEERASLHSETSPENLSQWRSAIDRAPPGARRQALERGYQQTIDRAQAVAGEPAPTGATSFEEQLKQVLDQTDEPAPAPQREGPEPSLLEDIKIAGGALPAAIKSAYASFVQGGDPEAIFKDTGWKRAAIEEARRLSEEAARVPGAEEDLVDFLGIKLTRRDVRTAPTNLSFTLISLGSSLLGAIAGSPLGRGGQAVGAGAAGGAAAYRMSANQFMHDFRQAMDAASQQQIGRKLTDDEFIAIAKSKEMQQAAKEYGLTIAGKGSAEELARAYGFHEAGWEALGNVIMLGAGKYIVGQAIKGKIIKPIAAALGASAGEVATEVPTQIGQQQQEVRAGIQEGPERSFLEAKDYVESFKEVAGPTLLTTVIFGGGAGAVGVAGRAIRGKPEQEAPPAAPSAPGPAIPPEQMTHRLDDGTPVRPVVEKGLPLEGWWEDTQGRVHQERRADPIRRPVPNSSITINGVEYEMEVIGKGRQTGTARVADGQELPIDQFTELDDTAKGLLGLAVEKPTPATAAAARPPEGVQPPAAVAPTTPAAPVAIERPEPVAAPEPAIAPPAEPEAPAAPPAETAAPPRGVFSKLTEAQEEQRRLEDETGVKHRIAMSKAVAGGWQVSPVLEITGKPVEKAGERGGPSIGALRGYLDANPPENMLTEAVRAKVAEIEGRVKETRQRIAKGRAKVDTSKDSAGTVAAKMGGVNVAHRLDITGEDKGNMMVPFAGPLFTKNGLGLDDLALFLHERGYLTDEEFNSTDGGVDRVIEMISDEFRGRRKHFALNVERRREEEDRDRAGRAEMAQREREEREERRQLEREAARGPEEGVAVDILEELARMEEAGTAPAGTVERIAIETQDGSYEDFLARAKEVFNELRSQQAERAAARPVREEARRAAARPGEAPARAAPGQPRAPERAGPAERPERAAPEGAQAQVGKLTLFRGYRREDRLKPYTDFSKGERGVPVLGQGRYYAFEEEDAKRFGPLIEKLEITPKNALVVESDDQWRGIAKGVGWEYPNPAALEGEQRRKENAALQAWLKRQGFDAVVVRWDDSEPGDIDEQGRGIKLLRRTFGLPQVFIPEWSEFYSRVEQPTTPYEVTRFASGMSRPADFEPALEQNAHVGVEIGELSDSSMQRLANAMAKSEGQVFVDSGAFSVFRANEQNERQFSFAEFGAGGKGLDFDGVMDQYDKLSTLVSKASDGEANGRLFFVMPDVVGNQEESLNLAKKYAVEIGDYGDQAIVPIQAGELSLLDVFDHIKDAVGWKQFRVGIPSNEKAAPPDQVKELLQKRGDSIIGVHFLGAASKRSLAARMKAVADSGFDGEVSGDANVLRSALYGSSSRAEALRKILEQPKAPYNEEEGGTSPKDTKAIADLFEEKKDEQVEDDFQVTHIFDAPRESQRVRADARARVYHKQHGWMTPAEAKAKLAEWKANAEKQGKTRKNNDKVVLSLFDRTGEWAKPWEEAGYNVYLFDIQADEEFGDVTKFSTEFFNDMFGSFEGMDVYAILAACPCTDFAVSGAKHFAAKDADGRTHKSVELVEHTLAAIEYFKPAVWALENPVGRIEKLTGLPPWRLSFNPSNFGDPYTKMTLLWGRFNGELPLAPVEPTEGSKMWSQYGGKSQKTKNLRSVTPEGFAYSFFAANNAIDHPAMAIANKYDRLDADLINEAVAAGVTEARIDEAVEDFYYQELDDAAANNAIRKLLQKRAPKPKPERRTIPVREQLDQLVARAEARRAAAKDESIKGLRPTAVDWMTPQEFERYQELQAKLIPETRRERAEAAERVKAKRAARRDIFEEASEAALKRMREKYGPSWWGASAPVAQRDEFNALLNEELRTRQAPPTPEEEAAARPPFELEGERGPPMSPAPAARPEGEFALEGETAAQIKEREEREKAQAKAPPAPPAPKTTADQADLFNTQLTLFQTRAQYDLLSEDAGDRLIRAFTAAFGVDGLAKVRDIAKTTSDPNASAAVLIRAELAMYALTGQGIDLKATKANPEAVSEASEGILNVDRLREVLPPGDPILDLRKGVMTVLLRAAMSTRPIFADAVEANESAAVITRDRKNPIVQVEFDGATVWGTVGEGISYKFGMGGETDKTKWGELRRIVAIDPDVQLHPTRISYLPTESNAIRQRQATRNELKILLGSPRLVNIASKRTKEDFLFGGVKEADIDRTTGLPFPKSHRAVWAGLANAPVFQGGARGNSLYADDAEQIINKTRLSPDKFWEAVRSGNIEHLKKVATPNARRAAKARRTWMIDDKDLTPSTAEQIVQQVAAAQAMWEEIKTDPRAGAGLVLKQKGAAYADRYESAQVRGETEEERARGESLRSMPGEYQPELRFGPETVAGREGQAGVVQVLQPGEVGIAGFRIKIETLVGEKRRPEWPALQDDYGEILGVVGKDKDYLDVFVKTGTAGDFSGTVFVVNQTKADGSFDEHKVLLGYGSLAEARRAYQRNYAPGWDRGRSIVPISMPAFRLWAADKSKTGPKGGRLTLRAVRKIEDGLREISAATGEAALKVESPSGRDLFATYAVPREIPVPQAAPGAVLFEHVVTGPEETGRVRLPAGQITNVVEAAQAFLQLRRSPRERFQIIGVNEADVPIVAFELFAGTITQTSVYPREIVLNLVTQPGVKKVWVAHNHPSGIAIPSAADQSLDIVVKDVVTQTGVGVEYKGHVIIGGKEAVEFSRGTGEGRFTVPPADRGWQEVPIVERMIQMEEFDDRTGPLQSPQAVREYIKMALKDAPDGLLFLDAQNRPLAYYPISVAEMRRFGEGDMDALARLFRQISRNNPSGIMVVARAGTESEQQAMQNLKARLAKMDVRMLDVFNEIGRPGLVSWAERGLMQETAAYEAVGTVSGESTVESLHAELAPTQLYHDLWGRIEIAPNAWHWPRAIHSMFPVVEGYPRPGAVFHEGRIYMAANRIFPGDGFRYLLHEAVGHMGIEHVLNTTQDGMKVKDVLEEIYQARKREIDRETRVGRLKPWNLDPDRIKGHRWRAAAEWIATRAERGENQALWKRLVAAIRNWLRQLGAVKEWTDNDILYLLKLSRYSLSNTAVSMDGMPSHLIAMEAVAPAGQRRDSIRRELYAVRDGRLTGIAVRSRFDATWEVRTGTGPDLRIRGKFHSRKARSAEEARRLLSTAGEVRFLPPDDVPPHDLGILYSGGRAFDLEDTDINRLQQYTVHPRTIASFDRDFAPLVMSLEAKAEYRDQIITEIWDTLRPMFTASAAVKKRVFAVLELGRLKGEIYGTGTEPVVATNTGQNAALTRRGERITLTDEEKSVYWAVRRAMDQALDFMRDEHVREHGLDPARITEPEQVLAAIPAGATSVVRNQMMRLARDLTDLREIRRNGYVPFSRWGSFGIYVRDRQGNTIHFEQVESIGRFFSGRKAIARADELRELYPQGIVSQPFFMSPARASDMVDFGLLDNLATVARLDPAQYEAVRDRLAEAQRTRGFGRHLMRSENVAGYSVDFERSIADYVVGLASYTSRRRYREQIQSDIGSIPAHKPRLFEFARKTAAYADSPQEEYQLLRQTNYVYYLAAVPMTAAVNASQPWLTTWPILTALSNPAKSSALMARAYVNTTAMVRWNVAAMLKPNEFFDPARVPADVRAGLVAAWEKGILAPMTTMEMMGLARNRAEALRKLGRRTRQSVEFLAHMFMTAERANRIVTYIASYRLASEPGMRERILQTFEKNGLAMQALDSVSVDQFPAAFAEYMVDETQFRTGKVNRATLQRNIGTAIFQFKDYPWQMIELYMRMGMVGGARGKVALGLMLLLLGATAGLWGLPFADNLRKLYEFLYKGITDRDLDLRLAVRDAINDMTDSPRLAEAASAGVFRYVDDAPELSTRIGLGNILPNINDLTVLGVPADLLWKRGEKAAQWIKRDEYGMAAAQMAPNLIKNWIEAEQWKESGVRSQAFGSLIIPPEDLTAWDIWLKRLGGRTRKIAEQTESEYAQQRASHAVDDMRRAFTYRIGVNLARSIRAQERGDAYSQAAADEKVQEAWAILDRHNEQHPLHEQVIINVDALRRRVEIELVGPALGRELRAPKTTREERQRIEEVYQR